MVNDRSRTGIPAYKSDLKSLDEILEGGIPKNNIVLITGPPGSAKSTLSLQYMLNGAKDFKEKGLYVTFEQSREDIIKSANAFNWDIENLEKNNLIKIVSFKIAVDHPISITREIMGLIDGFRPDRIVFDSLSSYLVSMETVGYLEVLMDFNLEQKTHVMISPEMAMRRSITQLIDGIKRFPMTAILISERPEGSEQLSRDGISEFLADGVIILNFIGVATEEFGNIQVRKMRHTKHSHSFYQTHITPNGLCIGEETIGTTH